MSSQRKSYILTVNVNENESAKNYSSNSKRVNAAFNQISDN